MRKPFIAILCVVVASLLPAGTANAARAGYPIRNADVLTSSPLYLTGRLPGSPCPEPPVRAGDVASVKSYLLPLVRCLDGAWAAQFRKARMPFVKPAVRFITKPQRVCGGKWGQDVQALYCNTDHEIVFMLDRNVVDHPEDLFLMNVIAHEYGHHVQNQAGMWAAFDNLPSGSTAEYYEQTRRHELQAECLAGAFIGSVWTSLGRTGKDWRTLLADDRASGDETAAVRDHGKGRNMANWLNRGYRAAAPGGCDTWMAGSAAVA